MRRFIISILIIVMLALGAGAIYMGYKLSEKDNLADDSPVAGTCGTCSDGTLSRCCGEGGDWVGTCSDTGPNTWIQGWLDCNGGGGGGCTVSTISGDKTSFTLSSDCSNADKIKVYERAYSGTSSAFYPTCVTDDSNGILTRDEGATSGGSYNSYKIGKCVQIDAFKADGTFLIGVCRCEPEEEEKVCNDICSKPSDCPSELTCSNGRCRNADCPTKANCICSVTPPQASCGNNSCETGENCEIIDGVATSCSTNEQIATCRSDCTFCGDGVVQSGEDCDHGGTPTAICDTNCQTVLDCGDTCTSTSECPTSNTCDSTTGKCVLSVCLDSAVSCTDDMCDILIKPLPQTALIDDSSDTIILALIAVVGGLLIIKFDLQTRLIVFIKTSSVTLYQLSPFSDATKQKIRSKQRKKFEDKLK